MAHRLTDLRDEVLEAEDPKPIDSIVTQKLEFSTTLELLKEERSKCKSEIDTLAKTLRAIEREVNSFQMRTDEEENAFRNQLNFIFFEYLPKKQSNYSKVLGAVKADIIERQDRIGDYDIGQLLGDGFYASVFMGIHRENGSKCALKRLTKSRMAKLHTLIQLGKELSVLSHVKHPNIIEMISLIHAPTHIYLVLELGHGDLFKFIRDHPVGMTLDTVREISAGVLKGLAHLHDNGIAHMDLKAENVLVMADVSIKELSHIHIKLCDLGLVEFQSSPGRAIKLYRLAGTPGYFAPEMITDLEKAEGRSADMWSFGALMIEVIETLDPEWIEAYTWYNTDKEKFQNSISKCLIDFYHRYAFPDFELHDLLVRCLQLGPEHRISSTNALSHNWFATKYDPANEDPDTTSLQTK